ncbi:MAG TPA: hypothetical protein VFS43_36800 [Polyangiaceae bacterium]|nr:hypothetical protein [Polyangiaceae bacterium]
MPKGPAAENLATVRRVALPLGRDTTTKLSLRKRTQRSARDDEYGQHLLTPGTS